MADPEADAQAELPPPPPLPPVTTGSGTKSWVAPAFSLVYGAAFAATLYASCLQFYELGLPDRIKAALPTPEDQSAAFTSLVIFAVTVSIYIFVLYLRLELFEHGSIPAEPSKITTEWRISEFVLRLIAVTLITLKLIKWTDFGSLLQFHFCLTVVLCAWLFNLRRVASTESVRLAGYVALSLLTLAAWQLEEGQVPTVMILQMLIPPMIITIGIAFYETSRVCAEIKAHLTGVIIHK